jgi:hypothetical protein
MSWVWLSPPELDFGGDAASGDGAEKIVWLHADPFGFLGVPSGADRIAVRRAYRHLARQRHPDAGSADGPFEELQRAVSAVLDEDAAAEVSVEPAEGGWWSFSGFVRPTRQLARGAVVGLAFELHDLDGVPLSGAQSGVRVVYGGEVLPLRICYSRSAASLPVLRAKAAWLLESTALILLCLTLIPIIAFALALEAYFLSDDSALVFWLFLLATIGTGYGALTVILGAAGKPAPHRRAFARLRQHAGHRLALPRGRT